MGLPREVVLDTPRGGHHHACEARRGDGVRHARRLIASWERSLRAGNKSSKTIRAYGDSARLFRAFARDAFGIELVDRIKRETVESFIEDQLARWKPTTASVRYRCLQQLSPDPPKDIGRSSRRR